MKFEELGMIEPILKAIKEKNFEQPTEIQEKTIPLVIAGKDVIGGSATGSGKTLAFATGIIQNSTQGEGIQALILDPTRELAMQSAEALKEFSKYKKLKITTIYGGVSITPQMYNLETADVVIGTPGRILDHLSRGTMDLSNVKTLVLDEADRMLDMGFVDDVEKIMQACPKEKQTLLFSATISEELLRIQNKYMNDPVKVSAISHVDPTKLTQVYYDVPENMKFSLLAHLLKGESRGLVMVFCNTRSTTDFVEKNLKVNGIHATAIHGGLTQARRTKIMELFHSKTAQVLICTDVAARGLDIPGVTHVYNYNIPNDTTQYIHRVGRTARAGEEGKAVSLISERDYDNFSRLFRDFDVTIPKQERPQVERVKIVRTQERREKSGFQRQRRRY